jgi:hypothetical protein
LCAIGSTQDRAGECLRVRGTALIAACNSGQSAIELSREQEHLNVSMAHLKIILKIAPPGNLGWSCLVSYE